MCVINTLPVLFKELEHAAFLTFFVGDIEVFNEILVRLVTRLHIAVGAGVKKQADERCSTLHMPPGIFLSISKMSSVTVAVMYSQETICF
jgi:hypothetical protein